MSRVLAEADQRLYEAKRSGRNRVVVEEAETKIIEKSDCCKRLHSRAAGLKVRRL